MADLREIERTDGACHTDRNTGVGVHQHRREGSGKERRLLERVVVVVDKVNRILIDIAEQLLADVVQTRFRITGGRPSHIAGIEFTEVALGVDKRVQQRLIAAAQAHHGIVDRGVAVRVQLHRLADNIGALGTGGTEQPHFIHGKEQLPVRRLETVNLRDGARQNNAHGVGHIVLFQRIGDPLLHHLSGVLDHTVHRAGRTGSPAVISFSGHSRPSSQLTSTSSRYRWPNSAM